MEREEIPSTKLPCGRQAEPGSAHQRKTVPLTLRKKKTKKKKKEETFTRCIMNLIMSLCRLKVCAEITNHKDLSLLLKSVSKPILLTSQL